MERRIEQVHLQITRNCNLRCYFCGQWGKRGFFSDASGEPMSLDDWEKVISDLKAYRERTGLSPFVMLWGGEPLVCPWFDRIATLLYENHFKIGMVTNGVLLNRHTDVVNKCVQRVFVSLDGTAAVHDSIRGEGVFEKATENLKQITGPKVTVMSVVTEQLLEQLPEFIAQLNETNISELYLQDMIGLTQEEILSYKNMMKTQFGIEAQEIDGWLNVGKLQFHEEVSRILSNIDTAGLRYPVEQKKHDPDLGNYCLSPFRHVHVTWNGDVTYCTDFYDFTAGNVKEEDLETIFMNEKSQKFRAVVEAGNCTTCRHCSWKNNRNYG